jgi:hypothetical protein
MEELTRPEPERLPRRYYIHPTWTGGGEAPNRLCSGSVCPRVGGDCYQVNLAARYRGRPLHLTWRRDLSRERIGEK